MASRPGLLTCLLLAAAAAVLSCGPRDAPAPQTAAPTPTPRQTIEESSQRMVGLDTVRFSLIHEGDGSSQLFPGVGLTRVEGEVDMPDGFAMSAEAVSLFPRSFIDIELVVSGDRALMTDFLNRENWLSLPVETLPFDFADLGRTLGDVMLSMEAPVHVGEESVEGVPCRHISGAVESGRLAALIPGAAEGLPLAADLWIGKDEALLRQVRIQGRILSTDEPDLVRVLTMRDFDRPVEITLPQT